MREKQFRSKFETISAKKGHVLSTVCIGTNQTNRARPEAFQLHTRR